jgi:putative glutamine amidotransferase
VGVTCDYARVRDQPAQAVIERYYSAVQRFSDVCAVLIPETSEPDDLESLLGRLDGVLLTGSPSNVEPSLYGEIAECSPIDPARDRTTFPLISRARAWNLPIFGICRGLQEINVAFGGTLRRDLGASDPTVRHHAEKGAGLNELFETKHPISIEEGGILASLFPLPEMEVNSVHHQGIARLGAGLNVEARAPDGVIEAIAAEDAPIIGVQWHPEWQAVDNASAIRLFRMFGACVRGASLRQAAQFVVGNLSAGDGGPAAATNQSRKIFRSLEKSDAHRSA